MLLYARMILYNFLKFWYGSTKKIFWKPVILSIVVRPASYHERIKIDAKYFRYALIYYVMLMINSLCNFYRTVRYASPQSYV